MIGFFLWFFISCSFQPRCNYIFFFSLFLILFFLYILLLGFLFLFKCNIFISGVSREVWCGVAWSGVALLYAFRVIFIIIVTWDMGIYGNQEWEMGELEKLSTPLCRRPFYGLLLIYYLFLYFYIFFFFYFLLFYIRFYS